MVAAFTYAAVVPNKHCALITIGLLHMCSLGELCWEFSLQCQEPNQNLTHKRAQPLSYCSGPKASTLGCVAHSGFSVGWGSHSRGSYRCFPGEKLPKRCGAPPLLRSCNWRLYFLGAHTHLWTVCGQNLQHWHSKSRDLREAFSEHVETPVIQFITSCL